MDQFPLEKPPRKVNLRLAVFLLLLFAVASLASGVFLGRNLFGKNNENQAAGQSENLGELKNKDGKIPEYLSQDVDFNLFWDTWKLVKGKYYDKNIGDAQLFYGALQGLVDSLGDPYSIFMTPQGAADFEEELKGNFEGIGAEIGIRNSQLTILSPLPDSPALKAGLRGKDSVLKIDSRETTDLSLDKAVSLIRGPKGTTVVLTIFREGFSEPKEISIVRDQITVKSLTWEFKDKAAIIKVRQFNDDTMPLFNDAIVDILNHGETKGVILDLRYNPGGYLDSAVEMSAEWVDGELVVFEKLRDGGKIEYKGKKKARLADYKTVVLVNGGSASGSEIVAGALKDWKKAQIVGEKTFGKGSVQDVVSLSDGSSVKLTVAKWFTPLGTSIQDEGIGPDIEVKMTDDDFDKFLDPQMDKALAIILGE